MTTISSLTTTTLYVSQSTISISSTDKANNDDRQQRRDVSGMDEGHHQRHRHHGGGSFMRNVVQTLQSLGLNFPSKDGGSSTDDGNDDSAGDQANSANLGQLLQGFLQDLRQILKQHGITPQTADSSAQSGAKPAEASQKPAVSNASTSNNSSSTATVASQTQAQATVPAATTTSATAQTATTSAPVLPTATSSANNAVPTSKAIVADVREALHSFLHDLRQALKLSAERRQRSPYADDDRLGGREIGRNGYGKFTDNLQNLIDGLGKTGDTSNGKYQELQDSFSRLVELLGNSANGKKPTLVEFLNKLAGNGTTANPTPTAKGSIISATA